MFDTSEVVGRSYGELDSLGKPANPEDPEFFWDVLWDRQTFTSNGSVALNFFTAVPADQYHGDMPLAGQLQAREYFVPVALTFDALIPVEAAAAAVPGTLSDTDALIATGNGVLFYSVQSKPYLRMPLRYVPSFGGVTGSLANGATATPATLSSVINNPKALGWPLAGIPLLKPSTVITINVQFPAKITLVNGNTDCILGIHGVHYRPIQ